MTIKGIREKIAICLNAFIAAGSISTAAVAASPHQGDYFSRTTSSPSHAQTNPARPQAQPAAPVYIENVNGKKWFEFFDDAIAARQPTAQERAVLNRPFNQNKDRIVEWTNVAAKIARQYRELARGLRATPVPQCLAPSQGDKITVDEYKKLTADWYDDSAEIFEEYIRPRKAARTIEELDETLARIHDRSEALSSQMASLKTMDRDLRDQFNLPLNLHDDAVQKYARKKLQANP